MDAEPLNSIVLSVVGAAVFFYILYGVIRAAVRDGIVEARCQAEKATQSQSESFSNGS
jgi:hypothetical protein